MLKHAKTRRKMFRASDSEMTHFWDSAIDLRKLLLPTQFHLFTPPSPFLRIQTRMLFLPLLRSGILLIIARDPPPSLGISGRNIQCSLLEQQHAHPAICLSTSAALPLWKNMLCHLPNLKARKEKKSRERRCYLHVKKSWKLMNAWPLASTSEQMLPCSSSSSPMIGQGIFARSRGSSHRSDVLPAPTT